MPKVTIKDVAALAGVSPAAVSFAYNHPGRLPPATVARVLSAAEELGYHRDPTARALRRGRTDSIGILIPQSIDEVLKNPYFTEYLRGVGRLCQEQGLSVHLVPPHHGSIAKGLSQATVDGFLVIGLPYDSAEVRMLCERNIPYVLVDGEAPDGAPSITVDDKGCVSELVTLLLEQGHRKFGVVSMETGTESLDQWQGTVRGRLRGVRDALDQHSERQGVASPRQGRPTVGSSDARSATGPTLPRGEDKPQLTLVEVPCTMDGGRYAFRKLHETSPEATAVIAFADVLAIGVMDAARHSGLRLPQDLSVVGFDDIPQAQWVFPALTTVHQPIEEKGYLSAKMLQELVVERAASTAAGVPRTDSPKSAEGLAENIVPRETVRLNAEVIQRDSVAAPRQRLLKNSR